MNFRPPDFVLRKASHGSGLVLLDIFTFEVVPIPGAASESFGGLSSPESNGYLDTPIAFLVLISWMATFVGFAFVGFGRRDS